MITIKDTLEINKYNEDFFSIKDLSHDIDIKDHKWDHIFEFLLKETDKYYFLGEHLNFSDKNLSDIINIVSKEIYNSNHYKIFFSLRDSAFLASRVQLSKLWGYYENPAIFFLSSQSNELALLDGVNRTYSYDKIVSVVGRCYLIYQSFEVNVMWFQSGRQSSKLDMCI